jgi:hypothetical protein
MIERGQCLCFAREPREPVRVLSERLGQYLDRDLAVELRVARPIDLAHATGAERAEDLEGAERRARGQGQLGGASIRSLRRLHRRSFASSL